jgi:hypothetical protein
VLVRGAAAGGSNLTLAKGAWMTPDLQQRLKQQYRVELAKRGVSLEDFFADIERTHPPGNRVFHLGPANCLKSTPFACPDSRKQQNATFKMREIAGEWKLGEEFLPVY